MKFAAPDCGSRKCGIAVRHCILRSRPRPRKGMSNVPERCWNTVLDCLLQGNRSACADRPVDVVAGSKVSAGIFRSIVVEGRKPAEPERVAEAEASSIPSYEAFRVGPFVPDGPCFAGRSDRVKRTDCVKSRTSPRPAWSSERGTPCRARRVGVYGAFSITFPVFSGGAPPVCQYRQGAGRT